MSTEILPGNENFFYVVITSIIGLITAVILGLTLWKNSVHINHQTSMDLSKFYSDFDTKLRDVDKELRLLFFENTTEVYHYMVTIIVTLNIIIRIKQKYPDFDESLFEEWFKYGLHLFSDWNEKERRRIDPGDKIAITKLEEWCLLNKIEKGNKIIPRSVVDENYHNLKETGPRPILARLYSIEKKEPKFSMGGWYEGSFYRFNKNKLSIHIINNGTLPAKSISCKYYVELRNENDISNKILEEKISKPDLSVKEHYSIDIFWESVHFKEAREGKNCFFRVRNHVSS